MARLVRPARRPPTSPHHFFGRAEFTLTTLNGTSLSVSSDASDLFPLFLAFLDPHDAFSLRSWSSRDSLRGFLETAPVEATYVFLSHGGAAWEARRWDNKQRALNSRRGLWPAAGLRERRLHRA